MVNGMDYLEGKKYMLEICSSNPAGRFRAYENIFVNYPGRKEKGDYRLEIEGNQVPTHEGICRKLNHVIKQKKSTYALMNNMLEHTFYFGTKELQIDNQLKYLQHLIYWATLQEEINYPREKGCAGINLPFCRYYEAIFCTTNNMFTIEDVYRRCNNHCKSKPVLYNIINSPNYYTY